MGGFNLPGLILFKAEGSRLHSCWQELAHAMEVLAAARLWMLYPVCAFARDCCTLLTINAACCPYVDCCSAALMALHLLLPCLLLQRWMLKHRPAGYCCTLLPPLIKHHPVCQPLIVG